MADAKEVAGYVWIVDCGNCGGRRRAKTTQVWRSGYDDHRQWREKLELETVPVHPTYTGAVGQTYSLNKRGICATCGTPSYDGTGDFYRVKVLRNPGGQQFTCDVRCTGAEGDQCSCECFAACHGLGRCDPARHEAPPSEPASVSSKPLVIL